MKHLTLIILAVFSFYSCQKTTQKPQVETPKGMADAKSEAIVDKMIEAMGGQGKYDSVESFSWTFFGSRKLNWNKKEGTVEIENPRDTTRYFIDLNNMEGKYYKNNDEIKDTAVVSKMMKRAKSMWINDSYWLVMPFKLRDEGVNLTYIREDTINGGHSADVLQLTFENVGDTPDNKYEVYVDHRDHLIKKWSFYKDAKQEIPNASWPWDNYQDFAGLKMSTDRSDNSGPSELKVVYKK